MEDSSNRNPPRETSPGGSVIHRYASAWGKPRLGFTEESTENFVKQREAVYGRLFDEIANVSHEVLPQVPHIDVYTCWRTAQDGRKVCILATGGMSDVEMAIPAGADAPRRVELIFYCSEPRQQYIDTMRWLAHFPHNHRTWLGSGHTIPNGTPPAPFWDSPVLDTILLMPTIVSKDAALPEQLQFAGEPVHFLWIVPLSGAECELKLAKGFGAIMELFGQRRHPYIFDANRPSYV